MRLEPVTLCSGPVHCAADLYLPGGSGRCAPGVVMGHSVTMVKEALRPHADHLVRAGFAVLALDFRTIGSSEGEPRCQWFPERQVQDMRAAVSFLRGRREVDPQRIGLWGHSTAAGVAVVAGALDRRIAAVACQNPSMLDGWTALQTSLGRAGFRRIRALLEHDFDQRYETGEGASIPALPTDEPKLAGYVAQAEKLFPTFTNRMTVESLDHVLLWAPVHFLARLAPTPLLMVSGVDDDVHAVDQVLGAYQCALEPKRLELLAVDEFGLSIEPGLSTAMGLAAGFFDQHLRHATPVVPSPTSDGAWSRGLRPEYRAS
jgi:uncharacterized protein